MVEWPRPNNVRELRGFLGLTGYYRKFVENYGAKAFPLTQLTQKEAFEWNDEAQEAFDNLKRSMITLPVLALPDFSQPFIVETDASGTGLGAVLTQNQKPIAYFSQSLSPRAQAKSIYEKELMAIVKAVQKWRPYLLGQRFLIRTDQQALRFLVDQTVIQPEYQKWISKLLGYNFEVQYRPGLENKATDALSRLPPVVSLFIKNISTKTNTINSVSSNDLLN
ncbi:MAG: ribonuclease H family protein, partial [Sweet potato little leaf phytoplasma]|nr:ribonuclease H family protein [Sweet potato little leaf phytoplasma]